MKISVIGHRPAFIKYLCPEPNEQILDRRRGDVSSNAEAGTLPKKTLHFGVIKFELQQQAVGQRSRIQFGRNAQQHADKIYFSELAAWARRAETPHEQRSDAVARIKEFMADPPVDGHLDLNSLSLRRLPDRLPASTKMLSVVYSELDDLPHNLPPGLTYLSAKYNKFEVIPEHLPDSIEMLDFSNTEVTVIPEKLPASLKILLIHRDFTEFHDSCAGISVFPAALPPLLECLSLTNNRLISMPDDLPAGTARLNLPYNFLRRLPDNLPRGLTRLDVSHNCLTSLPENITEILSSDCTVNVSNNPLSQRVRDNLAAVINAPGYSGPTILFSMESATASRRERPLDEAVADWLGPDRPEIRATWKQFQSDACAGRFSLFLDRLRDTVNFSDQGFRDSVVEWLSHLAQQPALREHSFLLSADATESCEDRVSLAMNDMKKLRLASDIECGKYDHRLGDVLSLARGMFRLDALETIARDKVQSLRFVDEIEVYLAYQVKLRDALQLPLDTVDMRFFSASYVTADDLEKATQRVLETEKTHFADYLSTDWQPWQAVLKRADPVGYASMQSRLLEAMGGRFQRELDRRLLALGMTGDGDATRVVGAQVRKDIAYRIQGDYTREFLRTENKNAVLGQ